MPRYGDEKTGEGKKVDCGELDRPMVLYRCFLEIRIIILHGSRYDSEIL